MSKLKNAVRFTIGDHFVFKVHPGDHEWSGLLNTLQGIPTRSPITSLNFDDINIRDYFFDSLINGSKLIYQIDLIDKFYGYLSSIRFEGQIEIIDQVLEMRDPQLLPYNGSRKFNPDLLTIKVIRLGFKIV